MNSFNNNSYNNDTSQHNTKYSTSTFDNTYRKSATTQPKRKFGIAGILILIWFFGSMILFAVTSRTNINISFMILGQIPLLLGILLLFKGEDARGKKPVVPAVIMSVIGLVIVVISLVLMFGSSTDIANLSILFPVLFFVIFNIAGVSLFIGPLYYSSMNNKIHTGTARYSCWYQPQVTKKKEPRIYRCLRTNLRIQF